MFPGSKYTYYDEITNTEYVFNRYQVFNGLREVLFTGRVKDPILAKFLNEYFLFPENYDLYNVTLPEQNRLQSETLFIKEPTKREIRKTRKKINENELNEYMAKVERKNFYKNLRRALKENEEEAIKSKITSEAPNVSNIKLKKIVYNIIQNKAKQRNSNQAYNGNLKQKYKTKKRDLKLKRALKRKTMKRGFSMNNNMNINNENYTNINNDNLNNI
jgi:vancomycin resistance protein YoaR